METVTESLERSLQNCSLNNNNNQIISGAGSERSASSHHPTNSGETTLELNSHISLPYHWEQCLDLKTGEIYYINWSNGMKAREDPRTRAETSEDIYSEDDDDDDDDCSYDSEESSSESSKSSSSTNQQQQHYHQEIKEDQVLVVAGCKSCFMYYMVPKLAGDCPKCSGQLLHFDRSQNRSNGHGSAPAASWCRDHVIGMRITHSGGFHEPCPPKRSLRSRTFKSRGSEFMKHTIEISQIELDGRL